jgi:hypothetical protein
MIGRRDALRLSFTAPFALTFMAAGCSYWLGRNAFEIAPPHTYEIWRALSLAVMLGWAGLVALCFARSRWLGVGALLASAYFPAITIYYFLNPVIGACTFVGTCP